MTEFLTGLFLLIQGVLLCLKVDLNFVEAGLLLLLCLFGRRLLLGRWFDTIEKCASRLSRRTALAIALAFLLPILIRTAFLPWAPVPAPWISDEFSHLLIADTLAHGRLVNPMHPLWAHFETIHEITRPVYASVYFPGLGAVMALGQLLGHPWIGILLSSGAMCAALLWMLYGFLPPRWALLGGAIAILRWGALSIWVNSYWGGTVAAAAGALVLGSYARLRHRPTVKLGVVLGIGLVWLAYTRPLEGFVMAAPAVAAIAWRTRRSGLLRFALPAAVVCGAGLVALGVYFKAITKDPFTTPYRLNQAMYGWPLTLPWQRTSAPHFRNFNMQLYYEYERCAQFEKTGLAGIERSTAHLAPIWRFFLGPAMMLPLFWTWRSWCGPKVRIPLVCLIASMAVGAAIVAYPHYIAPAAGCWLVLSVQSLRALRLRGRQTSRTGVALTRAVVMTCAIMLPVRAFFDSTAIPPASPASRMFSAQGPGEGIARERLLRRLSATEGRHVVFVQYNRQFFTDTEWVYNGADIDSQKVIWVQDMGPEQNQEVLRYYRDRRFWLVKPDDAADRILPYRPELSRIFARPIRAEVCAQAPEIHSIRRR